MCSEQQAELVAIVGKHAPTHGTFDSAIPGARCIRISIPQVLLEGEVFRYASSEFLAVSVDLPLVGQILEASHEHPYLCLQIAIDLQQLRELLAHPPARHSRWWMRVATVSPTPLKWATRSRNWRATCRA